ncbi:MAG: DUF2500 domain-containing protein [Ruminococcaceae bacterium]|nr:DUF2500 domain-containing protein [Oscillospiraceae bacterium]
MENTGVLSGALIPVILLVALIAFLIRVFIKASREAKEINDEILEELDNGAEFEAEPTAVRARVLSKEVGGYYSGTHQTPTYHTVFTVTFLTDAGETKEFNISKETFERIRENQYGLLLTINGNFFDFGDGEDIPAKEE